MFDNFLLIDNLDLFNAIFFIDEYYNYYGVCLTFFFKYFADII